MRAQGIVLDLALIKGMQYDLPLCIRIRDSTFGIPPVLKKKQHNNPLYSSTNGLGWIIV